MFELLVYLCLNFRYTRRFTRRSKYHTVWAYKTTITTSLLHILIHTPKHLHSPYTLPHLRLHFSPDSNAWFMSVTPDLRIVLSVFAQQTVCQPILVISTPA